MTYYWTTENCLKIWQLQEKKKRTESNLANTYLELMMYQALFYVLCEQHFIEYTQ